MALCESRVEQSRGTRSGLGCTWSLARDGRVGRQRRAPLRRVHVRRLYVRPHRVSGSYKERSAKMLIANIVVSVDILRLTNHL